MLTFDLQVMRAGNNQRPLTPGQGGQSQQESLAAAAAANPALAFARMPGENVLVLLTRGQPRWWN